MTNEINTIEDFIKELKYWYDHDTDGFKKLFDDAIANVKPIPEGQDPRVVYDWKNKGINDLCDFFLEWYNWQPDVGTGLDYIQKFSWLYYKNCKGLKFVTTDPGLIMTKQFVTIRGKYFDSPESKSLATKWIKELGPKIMDQFIIPPEGFQNYNEFFIRKIKPEARPIEFKDDESIVVAPADCVINMIVDDLTVSTKIPVKTVSLNILELLNDSKYANNFLGGTAVSCILMPNKYHWYHSPVAGRVIESNDDVSGEYFGIKDFPDLLHKGDVGYGYDYSVFEHFRRGYLIIKTNNYGLVGMIPVGLNTVASVVFVDKFKHITNPNDSQPIEKGEKVGYFKYGGSLNILLFEKGRFPSLSLLVGQRIGQLESNFTVQANIKWQDTGITLSKNNTATIRYNGNLWTANPATGFVDANGNSEYKAKPGYTLPGAYEGALCGRIGESGEVFPIGFEGTTPKGQSGNLYLCINDDLDGRYGAGFSDNEGAIIVNIDIT
jgi:phosphatidylserine decarboxylase